MRLLQRSETTEFSLTEDLVDDDTIPPYAILSHTWEESQEVTFQELQEGTGRNKSGYDKIRFCAQQAERDGLQYFWVDTCCIDKSNNVELQTAINSMFRWYQNAAKCYVYLIDVSTAKRKASDGILEHAWEPAFRQSRWFTRGWTLQELLAPTLVEFFSKEWKKLGDKQSLRQQIRKITGIPDAALEGQPLSHFSKKVRFSWIQYRQVKVEEDKAYSLLGIFDVELPLRYGEGFTSASKRLEKEIDKLNKCLQGLRLTDPRHDKMRIEDAKGGLLEDSYRWIIENSDFRRWRDDPQSRLLWIKGDPGKGKTMLLCGIINELEKSITKINPPSYFFCQATDSRINSATAVLRGLMYLLLCRQPSLIKHVQEKYEHGSKTLFEDANAWTALSDIFTNILQDSSLISTYLIIDALDECVTDLPKLSKFIVEMSPLSHRVKWIVSSRNWPSIEKDLNNATQKVRLCLELNEESVSAAVATYIQFKVDWLAKRNGYNSGIRDVVQRYLSLNASDTFLWVALVCQELSNVSGWKAQQKLIAFPPGLDGLYRRMIDQIRDSDEADLCERILAVISTVYRPITLDELTTFVNMPEGVACEYKALSEIIGLCGSFLILQERTILFVHQSAKDFLFEKAFTEVFPSGSKEAHYVIFSRSLQVLFRTLRRDIYSLQALGYPIEQAEPPDPDPLATSRYSCIYWVDHLCDWNPNSSANHKTDLQDRGAVDSFIKEKYLYWLEALSLCKSLSKGVVSMAKLEALIQQRANASALIKLIQDARRFIMSHKWAIENSPLQAYGSALMFSPARSLIRCLFKEEEPKWIKINPAIGDRWSACLQTLEGHSSWVRSVAFSPDSKRLASGSDDMTVKIWDASSGECLQTLEGHSDYVNSVAFSPDSKRLASGSYDNTVKIWDASSGECLQTLEGHSSEVNSVAFSPDLKRLASGSYDNTVKIWDASSGECLQTLEGHSDYVNSVAFSPDSKRLASGSGDNTVKIWDASSGECLQTLEGHSDYVNSVAFSPDSKRLASGSDDMTVKIWDASSGECLQTLEGHSSWVRSVAFSPDSKRLASGSYDKTVKIWDASSGECLQTLEGHSSWVRSVAFSPDSKRLASGSYDNTVKIWDASSGECLQTLEGHSSTVRSVAFSPDSKRLASGSYDKTVNIWDASSGECLQTLEGHSSWVRSVAFSPDSKRLASGSYDNTVKIWDASSGECLQTLEGHSSEVRSVAFSPDSKRLASGSYDNTVKIWDASSGECLQTLEGHSSWVRSVAFSPDSKRLASGSYDKTVNIWDASSGECLQTLEGHSSWVRSVAFSPDSKRLASGSYDKTVNIWDASSGECLQTLEGHSSEVRSVAFSPDSKRLASGSYDNTVKIWDASSGECLQTLEGHSSTVRSVAFSPDSKRLASGSIDNTVKIWDASSGECLQTLEGHSSWVRSVAFSPDSKRLASGSIDNTVKIWDASSGECLQTLDVGKALFNISFNATGSYLYTEIGTIVINAISVLDTVPSVVDPQITRYQGVGLGSDGAWITYNSENILWLPSEYRPSCSAVSGKTIGIGVGSGKVWICKVQPSML